MQGKQTMKLFLKSAAVIGVLFIVAIGYLWALGARQPSQPIYEYDKVVFLSLKHPDADFVRSSNYLADEAVWRASVEFAFIGTDDAYWTDYMMLPPDSGVIAELKGGTEFVDVYAAEVALTKVPPPVIGLLRAMHQWGITKRPDGPLPEPTDAMDELENRRDILPTLDAVNDALAAPPNMQITMMNYLEYFPLEHGGKEAGRNSYNRYGLEAMKAVHVVGGQFLFAGQISKVLIESEHESTPGEWDDLAAMIYPDPLAIFYMEQSESYKKALNFRDEGLERSIVIATEAYQ
jgi:uncharacterized protein (DUF1330 family)